MATASAKQTIERQLGRLEGRMEEQSVTLQQIRADLAAVNARIGRLFLANLALGGGLLGGLIGLIATLIVRGA